MIFQIWKEDRSWKRLEMIISLRHYQWAVIAKIPKILL